MSEQKDEGFKVVDRRSSAAQEQPKPAEAKGAEKVEGPGWEMRQAEEAKKLPRMDFTTFCLSLASSAMIHLGLAPIPETGERQVDLPLAQQTIDILALLEEKTRNNLTGDEQRLLGAVLYDLRLRYVEARSGRHDQR